MNSLSDARSASRRWPWMGAAALAALLLAWLAWPDASSNGQSWLLLGGALALGLLLLTVAALGWHIGVRLTRQRLGEALREARSQAQLLSQLQSDWQWQTDAQHHLVRWRAPQAAPASSWVGAAATETLWERFVLTEGEGHASLLQRLQEEAPFNDVEVCARLESGAAAQFSGRWLLRAQVCLDGQGRFAGHIGTARPLSSPQTSPRSSPVLQDQQAGAARGLRHRLDSIAAGPGLAAARTGRPEPAAGGSEWCGGAADGAAGRATARPALAGLSGRPAGRDPRDRAGARRGHRPGLRALVAVPVAGARSCRHEPAEPVAAGRAGHRAGHPGGRGGRGRAGRA